MMQISGIYRRLGVVDPIDVHNRRPQRWSSQCDLAPPPTCRDNRKEVYSMRHLVGSEGGESCCLVVRSRYQGKDDREKLPRESIDRSTSIDEATKSNRRLVSKLV